MKNIFSKTFSHNFPSTKFLSSLLFLSRFVILFLFSANETRDDSAMHVRPTHLSDDKYLILYFLSLCFSPIQHFLPVLKSKSLKQQPSEASAYLFSFNTNSRTFWSLAACVWVYVNEWQSRAESTEQKWNKKEFFSCQRREKTSSLCNASCFFIVVDVVVVVPCQRQECSTLFRLFGGFCD